MTESQTLAGAPQTTGTYTPGAFVWHEYNALDITRARKFYSDLLGWTIKAMPMEGGQEYPEIFVGEKPIGGFFQLDPAHVGKDCPAHWHGYVSVPDVDKATEDIKAAGGRVLNGPMDIPNVGRFTVAMDPQGAVFSVFRSLHGDPSAEVHPDVHEFCWDSLGSTDVPAAKQFYARAIGWQAEGDDCEAVFKFNGLMEASANVAPPGVPSHWLVHIYVEHLAKSRARAVELGGKVLMEEQDVGYGTIAVIQDPDGAVFSLFQPREETK